MHVVDCLMLNFSHGILGFDLGLNFYFGIS